MKKLLLVILMVLSVVFLQAQTIHGEVEAGVAINATWAQTTELWDYYYEKLNNVFYIKLMMYLELMKRDTGVRIGGDTITWMYDSGQTFWSYYPVYSSYTVWTELFFKNWSLGVEHNCSHEVLGSGYIGPILGFQSSYDKIYFRIRF